MQVIGYDHVGIRVSDRERALDFYRRLGFFEGPDFSNEEVAEVVVPDGTRINFIFNGRAPAKANNILLDETTKWPGVTHPAFIVDSLGDVLKWAAQNDVRITERPVNWGRRMTCFLCDPDGTVLEFNELLTPEEVSEQSPTR